jgi:ADP-glucose pyrophosphorylase
MQEEPIPDAIVEAGAQLEECILWPGAHVTTGSHLKRSIVRSRITATGGYESADL